MSVGVGKKEGPFFSSDFCFSDSKVLDKLMVFGSGASRFISLLLCFFLDLYLLRFYFLLSTITSFLNLLFLLQTDVVGCIVSRLIFRTLRESIFRSKMTTIFSYYLFNKFVIFSGSFSFGVITIMVTFF